MSGNLNWSVAYYDKAGLNPALKKAPGVDHDLPKELQDRPELKGMSSFATRCFRPVADPLRSTVETTAVDSKEEADVTRTPPDPQYPSGVLSVIVHQVSCRAPPFSSFLVLTSLASNRSTTSNVRICPELLAATARVQQGKTPTVPPSKPTTCLPHTAKSWSTMT